jgi:hypothetical protein
MELHVFLIAGFAENGTVVHDLGVVDNPPLHSYSSDTGGAVLRVLSQ